MVNMKTTYWIITLCLILFRSHLAQQVEFITSIGKFNSASSFHISASGIIYITDSGSDQITSFDTLGNMLHTNGGYGWTDAAFDEPSDIFANPLSIFVADKNNHRIQRFDRDLNFVSSLTTRQRDNAESRFGYPTGCVVSNQGDLYILDSENLRIIKFDLFGNFNQSFGGFDAGEFQLIKPVSMAVSPNNLIYVCDEAGVLIFDSFGNGVGRIENDEKFNSIRIVFDKLTLNTNKKVFSVSLGTSHRELNEMNLTEYDIGNIVSSLIYNNKLYILTPKEILVFLII